MGSRKFRRFMQRFFGGAVSAASIAALSLPAYAADAKFPTATVNTTGLAVTDDTVTVGQLHSVSGTMALSETGSVEAERLAISQINEAGGILGRKIKIVQKRRQRLADLRRKSRQAPRAGQVRGGLRLLDVGIAESGAARVREGQRDAVLPDLL